MSSNKTNKNNSSSSCGDIPMLRILCLHDSDSNALELKQSMTMLGEKLFLKHAIDCVYIDSPIPNQWYEEEEEDNNNSFRGLDASLLLLRQIWRSCGFWGILGVGQGAAMASLLLALLNDEEMMPRNPFFGSNNNHDALLPPQFAIFVSARSILETEEPVLPYELPVLHLIDDDATCSNKLVSQFPGTIEQRKHKHFFHTSDMNILGRFICEQRKFVSNNCSEDTSLVALRGVLEVAEREAADLLDQSIAEKPPAALLAVIRRNNAGVWQGPKRRDDVGGAPCPSEFLQTRQQRQSGGSSRVHPSHNLSDFENDQHA